MIKVLEEDIVFNELQGDPCKGQSPCVCPNIVQNVNALCPDCKTKLNACKWSCIEIGTDANGQTVWWATFTSGNCLVDCDTADTACDPNTGIPGNTYRDCKGRCVLPTSKLGECNADGQELSTNCGSIQSLPL